MRRTIWAYWDQGRDAMPDFAQRCIRSFADNNPDWEVVVLDRDSAQRHVSPDIAALLVETRIASPTHRADLLRLALLNTFGGIWIDADCWCRASIDTWVDLEKHAFFALADPGKDRPIATWFLAAEAGHPLVAAWAEAFRSYISANGTRAIAWPGARFPNGVQDRAGEHRLWMNPATRYLVPRLPCYAIHYVFAALLDRHDGLRRLFQTLNLPKADAALSIRRGQPPARAPASPAYKLSRRTHGLDVLKALEALPTLQPEPDGP